MQPILASSCARAATAAEARFRIDRPIGGRSALVVALVVEAAAAVGRVAERPWLGARFFASPPSPADLDDADVAIMVATAAADPEAAAAIARECALRGIMTAGLILGDRLDVAEAVAALRPYARNLMVTDDEDDLAAVLTALRA
jgi:hypothetical protein